MIRYGRGKLLVIGVIILAFGVGILYANRPERSVGIAGELVEATAVFPENEGKLVIVSGTPRFADGGIIIDEEAGLRVENAVSYSRIPRQKVYRLEERQVVVDEGEDKLSTVDDVKKTERYVVRDWIPADQKRDAVVSCDFGRYENPSAINMSHYIASGDLRVAGFRIDLLSVREFVHTEECGFTRDELEQSCGGYIQRSGIDLRAVADESGRGLLSSGDGIGDIHVVFSYETLLDAEPVTVIGRQRGDRVVPGDDGTISESEQVLPGTVSREEFLASITAEDASSRIYGIGGLALGAILILLSLDWRKASGSAKTKKKHP